MRREFIKKKSLFLDAKKEGNEEEEEEEKGEERVEE